jgi:hypothetical protein
MNERLLSLGKFGNGPQIPIKQQQKVLQKPMMSFTKAENQKEQKS